MTKVAFITGGSGVFGLALAEVFLKNDYKVCIGDMIRTPELEELERKWSSFKVHYVMCDVTNAEMFERALRECIQVLGGLSVLCANAGIADEKRWKLMIDVNITGVINAIHIGRKLMSKTSVEGCKTGGSILLTGSAAGVYYLDDTPIYSATKHAVVTLCKTYGNHPDFCPESGVKITCICPIGMHSKLGDYVVDSVSNEAFKDIAKQLFVDPNLVAKVAYQLATESPSGTIVAVDVDGSSVCETFADTSQFIKRNIDKFQKK